MPRVGVDVGGTFTDVVHEADGRLQVAKVPSTPADQSDGVLDGVRTADVALEHVERFVHGTTVATNTVLERDGAAVCLVVTEGFRDLLEIGRQDRPSLYDLTATRPNPLVGRDAVVEARERIGADGEVVTPLDDPGAVAASVAATGADAVAVSLLFSFLDGDHERAIEAAVRDATDAPISRSSDVLPVVREYERTSTTVLNAYVAPRMARYLGRLGQRLAQDGLATAVEVMRSGGGTSDTTLAGRYPVHTLLSGPAAGAWGAAVCAAAAGHRDVIAFDVGGTSTDVTLIDDGRPATTAEGAIGGVPFAVPTTDVHTVGAGGGSIAWRDDGGALRVGPRSAGADPGPAAYGRGGREPTVTDAHVVLGRLDPSGRLGGALELDAGAARAAVERLATELGLGVDETAEGIVRVAEAAIVRALRVVSVQRGRDPRRYALVAFGGAGPLHQAAVARELGCEVVLVPPHAGVLAALGLLAAPPAADAVRTHQTRLDAADADELVTVWQELEDAAAERIRQQGCTVEVLRRSADCRYAGQSHELEVTIDEPDVGALAAAFHATHRERYGYDQPDESVEVVNLRVRAEGPEPEVPLPQLAPGAGAERAATGERQVTWGGRAHDCRVYARDRLGAGDELEGPAVVAGADTTVFVAPDQRVEVDPVGTLVIR